MDPGEAAHEKPAAERARYAPVALVFLIRTQPDCLAKGAQVLLGKKKKGFGSGKYVGIGGHAEEGETFAQAAVREVQEEILVTPTRLCCQGQIDFIFPALPKRNMTAALYTCRQWEGTITETAEIKPLWFHAENLPYRSMWQDSKTWLPLLLKGEKIHATIIMAADNEHVAESTVTLLTFR